MNDDIVLLSTNLDRKNIVINDREIGDMTVARLSNGEIQIACLSANVSPDKKLLCRLKPLCLSSHART